MSRDGAYLLDMLIASRKIIQFTQGVTREGFERDEVLQNAIIRLLEVIGEAARVVSDERKLANNSVPWKQIVGMRYRLVHEYFRIDLERVWDTIQADVPELIRLIEPLVPADKS